MVVTAPVHQTRADASYLSFITNLHSVVEPTPDTRLGLSSVWLGRVPACPCGHLDPPALIDTMQRSVFAFVKSGVATPASVVLAKRGN